MWPDVLLNFMLLWTFFFVEEQTKMGTTADRVYVSVQETPNYSGGVARLTRSCGNTDCLLVVASIAF